MGAGIRQILAPHQVWCCFAAYTVALSSFVSKGGVEIKQKAAVEGMLFWKFIDYRIRNKSMNVHRSSPSPPAHNSESEMPLNMAINISNLNRGFFVLPLRKFIINQDRSVMDLELYIVLSCIILYYHIALCSCSDLFIHYNSKVIKMLLIYVEEEIKTLI